MRLRWAGAACGVTLAGIVIYYPHQLIGWIVGAITIFVLAAASAWDARKQKENAGGQS